MWVRPPSGQVWVALADTHERTASALRHAQGLADWEVPCRSWATLNHDPHSDRDPHSYNQVLYEERDPVGLRAARQAKYPLRGGDTIFSAKGLAVGWRRVAGCALGAQVARYVDERSAPGATKPRNFALLHRVS